MPQTPPVFLVAAEQSGTAILQPMLARHPEIAFAGNFEFLIDAISPDGRFMKRANFVKALEFDRAFKACRLSVPPQGNVPQIANSFFDQLEAATPGTKVVGAILHRDFDRILYLWPDARFIHLVRDGRDVAFATLPAGLAGTMWHAVRNWVEVEILWERMSHKLPVERQISVKYEVLARDPEYELRRITDFLGLIYDPAMLQGYDPRQAESAGKWRNADPADLSAAEHVAARWLLQNGYFLSGTVRPPSIIRRAALRIQHDMVVAKRQRELFGTRMWLKGVLTRRLGSKKAKNRLTRRQNEILDRSRD